MEVDVEREGKAALVETDNNEGPENFSRDADSYVSEEGRETSGFNIESHAEGEFNGNNDLDAMAIEHENSPLYKEPLCVDHLDTLHEEILNPLNNHILASENHVEESVLICRHPECEFSTNDSEEYLSHEYEHVDGKSYQCDMCHVKFNHFLNMRRHRMTHLLQRPYDCRLCSKTFIQKDCLLEHLVKQHSKQRPHHCPFCGRYFKLRPIFKLHLSREHCAATLIKTCKLCGFKAISPNSSRSHFAVCYYEKSRLLLQSKGLDMTSMQAGSEVNAIDLGAISQNFSFAPTHYTPFTVVTGENIHSVAGPSEVATDVSLHTTTPAVLNFSTAREQEAPNEPANRSPVTSSASSTTVVSPIANSSEVPQNLVMTNVKVFVKSEPSEAVDDSQNGCALPTSTMDLSAGNVVETSYNSNDATSRQTSPDLPLRLKTSCCSRDSERCGRGKVLPQLVEKPHVAAKRGFYISTKLKCDGSSKEMGCYSCDTSSHFQHWKKREANSRSQGSNLHEQAHCNCIENYPAEHRETQTDLPPESHYSTRPSSHRSSCHPHQNFSHVDSKSHIVIQKAVGNSLSCPYCEITFPDQTLYFLHRSLHSETHPWKCNLCGKVFNDRYDFNSHIISQGHH